MRSGTNKIDESFVKEIAENKLPYKDTIFVGDNSSGKSWVLKNLASVLCDNNQDLYFVDAVNRNFNVGLVDFSTQKPNYAPLKVLKRRLQDDYFNLKDSFSMYGTDTERIEGIYTYYEEKIQGLFQRLTGDFFALTEESYLGIVNFNHSDTGLLSSGYQAIVRILLELVYYSDNLELQDTRKAIVVIDELDEFLSPKICLKLWTFLKKEFEQFSFIVSTHSSDLIVGAVDANLVVLDNKNYEVLDSNDYITQTDVQCVFERVFGKISGSQENTIDDTLRRLLNNRVSNIWTEKEKTELKEIGNLHLSQSQKLIMKQIENWKER